MAIILNDNIKINAGKPSEAKYLSGTTAYASVDAVTGATGVPISERHIGLTVLVVSGASYAEYWFKDGVSDNNLIEKKFASEQLVGDFVTGATNLGYFEGQTGIQTLNLSGFPVIPIDFNTDYYSEYNWYYADAGGIIRIGSPTHDGPLRRAYVTANRAASWIWYDDQPSPAWILSNNDVIANVGFPIAPYGYDGTGYTEVTWATGWQSNGATSVDGSGSLTTGTTLTIGNPIYTDKSDQDLHLRTVINDTPEFLKIEVDDNYLRFSGASSVISGQNIGSGSEVFAGQTGSTLGFRRITPSGDTTITTGATGNLIIYSSSDGSGQAVTGGTNYGGGVEVFSGTTTRDMSFRTLVGSGGTAISTTTGGTIIINTEGGTYDLDSPSVCATGGMCVGTTLTGKTAFELFEEILVPVQNPTLTAPSVVTTLSVNGTQEIGFTIFPSLSVCSAYNAGCINPQYTAACDKRSDGVIGYCYTSTGGQLDNFYACTTSPVQKTIASYVVSAGTQTWGTCACHCSGVQPYDSKGNIYNTPLGEGLTPANSKSITGILPWYWGTKKVTNVINCDDVAAGTKTVVSANGTLSITYNSAADDYLWFAVPNGTDTKNSWFVCASNQGVIGGTGNLFATSCNVIVSSSLGCWAGCTFDVYASCFTTGTAAGVPMCMIP